MSKIIFVKIAPLALLALSPALVFANGDTAMETGYLAESWGDLLILLLVLISAGYAFLSAKIYGGVVGTGLKFLSIGLIVHVLHRTLESFETLGFSTISHDSGYILDIVGTALIAFGMWKLYSETKKMIPGAAA